MHDDSILVAVEDALRRPAFCACGNPQHLETRDGAIWLECGAFDRPTRLPAGLALLIRDFGHDRKFVVELPEHDGPALAA